MNTCNLIYTLLHQIPKNEMSLSDETPPETTVGIFVKLEKCTVSFKLGPV